MDRHNPRAGPRQKGKWDEKKECKHEKIHNQAGHSFVRNLTDELGSQSFPSRSCLWANLCGRGPHTFSIKGWIVNSISDFAGHISLWQLFYSVLLRRLPWTISKWMGMAMNGQVPIKLYLQKEEAGQIGCLTIVWQPLSWKRERNLLDLSFSFKKRAYLAVGTLVLVVAAYGLCCSEAHGILVPWQGIEPASLSLQGRFLTTGPAVSDLSCFFFLIGQSLLQFSCSVMSDSLRPKALQHTRPPCLSSTPGAHPNPCPLSWWCHPTISSSVVPFSFCSQSFPASGSFQMSQLFASGGQSITSWGGNTSGLCYLPHQVVTEETDIRHHIVVHHLTLEMLEEELQPLWVHSDCTASTSHCGCLPSSRGSDTDAEGIRAHGGSSGCPLEHPAMAWGLGPWWGWSKLRNHWNQAWQCILVEEEWKVSIKETEVRKDDWSVSDLCVLL